MIIDYKIKSSLKAKIVLNYWSIFLVTIISISKSISATSDPNLSDHFNYDHFHKHHYQSYPSTVAAAAPKSRIQANYQWVYSGNDNNNNHMNVDSDEQPSALTQIDRFFSTERFSDSTGISGHFPFDYHQKGRYSRHPFERTIQSLPSIPDIPPVPASPALAKQIHLSYPSSTYFLLRDEDMIYSNKNNYQNNGKNRDNDYNHGIKHYTTHDNSHNPNYRRWHSTDKFSHSFHHNYDSGAPNHDYTRNTLWIKSFSSPKFQSDFEERYGPDFHSRTRTRREHFSRRSSFMKDNKQFLPSINDQIVKNNEFFKELHFSYNIENNLKV